MHHSPLNKFDRRIGLANDTSRDRIFLVERLAAFVPRMPWIYTILLVNIGGLVLSLRDQFTTLIGGGVAALLLLVLRLVHWLRMPSREISEERARSELRRAFLIGAVITASYCAWILGIYAQSSGDARSHVVLFGSLAAMGCAYALSPMPSAAKIPLFLLGLPLALVLIAGGDMVHAAMGFALLTLMFVTLKLIDAQNVTFTRLVQTRIDIELEIQRAE